MVSFRIDARGAAKSHPLLASYSNSFLFIMLRGLGAQASCLFVGKNVFVRRMDFISVALSNHENTKRLEFHEIFESRISRIPIDFTGKTF